MKKPKSYKNTLMGAICSTLATVMIMLVTGNTINAKNNEGAGIIIVALIVLIISSIRLWIRGTKQYIDHRFQEIEKEKQEA